MVPAGFKSSDGSSSLPPHSPPGQFAAPAANAIVISARTFIAGVAAIEHPPRSPTRPARRYNLYNRQSLTSREDFLADIAGVNLIGGYAELKNERWRLLFGRAGDLNGGIL